MNVSELIAYLQTQPQDLQVAYNTCGEHCLLEAGDISIVTACAPCPDGWIQRNRKDKPQQTYLMLRGN